MDMLRMLVAAAVLLTGSGAQAQRYYARERVGIPGQPDVAPVAKCGPLVKGMLSADPVTKIGSAATSSAAQSVCDAARPARGAGSCTWIAVQGYSDSNFVYWSPVVAPTPWTRNEIWAARCA